MSIKKIFLTTFILVVGVFSTDAQCLDFAKSVCKKQLGTFVHDGNYNASKLAEGEEAELYKTFFFDQKYRISICKDNKISKVHFQIINKQGELLFDNKNYNYTETWDFEVKSTQMLTVIIKILKSSNTPPPPSSCVAILFGIEKREN